MAKCLLQTRISSLPPDPAAARRRGIWCGRVAAYDYSIPDSHSILDGASRVIRLVGIAMPVAMAN
ncbi:MAG: hypothetical protein ACRDG3_09385 [Tepidiformaceae bacterium]